MTLTVPPPPAAPAAAPDPVSGGRPARTRLRVPSRPRFQGPRRGSPAWIVRTSLFGLAAVAIAFFLDVSVVSRIEFTASQSRDYATLRDTLANATTPVSQTDPDGRLTPLGTPIATLSIPALGIDDLVVVEGTSGAALRQGPGHQRSTPFPGQAGVSILQGRAAAYGGPFGEISRLRAGNTITVVTGQGTNQFRVYGVRREGEPLPPVKAGQSWLSLVTAGGLPFAPEGLVRVDAQLVDSSKIQDSSVIYARDLPTSEQPLGTQPESLPVTALALQGLVVAVVLAVWSWSRFGALRTWIAFGPVVALAVVLLGDRIVMLLPNLL